MGVVTYGSLSQEAEMATTNTSNTRSPGKRRVLELPRTVALRDIGRIDPDS